MSLSPRTLRDAADEFLVYQESVRNLSANSVAGYRNDLEKLCRLLGGDRPLDSVGKEDIRFCVGELSRGRSSAATINRFVAAVRSLFAYCRRFEYIEVNPAAEISTVRQPRKMPRFMTEAEVGELCSRPEQDGLLWRARDAAIFNLLYSSGCRVSELAGLRLADLAGDCRSAIVLGKGGKERRVFFSARAGRLLRDYLLERGERVPRASKVTAVFVNQHGKPLTARGIRYIVERYSGLEGTNHPVSPHAFRHTFATTMLSHGADVRVVQELLGHSSVSTTQKYTHITTAQLVRTYNRAHPHGSSGDGPERSKK